MLLWKKFVKLPAIEKLKMLSFWDIYKIRSAQWKKLCFTCFKRGHLSVNCSKFKHYKNLSIISVLQSILSRYAQDHICTSWGAGGSRPPPQKKKKRKKKESFRAGINHTNFICT